MNPLVSILVANYNNSSFIAQTLDSAIAQSYDNIEIIIVDDKSTDDSVQLIQNYISKHPSFRISLFENERNLGCGGVKRRCVEYSNGAFFTFLDPEDTILSDSIQLLMEEHFRNEQLGIVYSTHYLCNDKLEPQSISAYPGRIPDGQSHLTSTGGHISALAVCRRSVYDKTSGINPEYQVSEDQDLYMKMEEQAPVLFVDKAMYYYRKHDHNTSWNEKKAYVNSYWKFRCNFAAYERRTLLRGTVDNISKTEYHKMKMSYYILQAKENKRNHRCFEMLSCYAKAIRFKLLMCIC